MLIMCLFTIALLHELHQQPKAAAWLMGCLAAWALILQAEPQAKALLKEDVKFIFCWMV